MASFRVEALTGNYMEDEEIWQQAKSLQDIGELTARWLEGKLSYYPLYGGDIDPEAVPLRRVLAKFNRNGFITEFSQPGEPMDEEGFAQRACVSGYADEAIAKKIACLSLYTELLVFIFEPGGNGGYQIPITVVEHQPGTWNGLYWDDENLEQLARDCSREALQSLGKAWFVFVLDLKWGRKAYLWKLVSKVLEGKDDFNERFSVKPSDYLGLDEDFIR
jgi:hypothetical protein